ncbi:hypothetical protein HXY33_04485 [Candidatus Bathyarchaeota archaeon]|nr:hypothetical protein [Candidatus Bathyarchaeota archaeon]
MPQAKEVPEKKYPPDVDYSTVLKGMNRVSLLDTTFHTMMGILLITGLVIDLLGPWLGGWLHPIREYAHGYIGALFVLVFAAYIGSVLGKRKTRTVFTVTNYVDLVFYIILIVTGVTTASINSPWIEWFPGIANVLSPLVVYAPAIHVVITYIWIAFSIIFPGGLLHGLASTYLIAHLKKKTKIVKTREE